jgi:adenine/guanine phosphoribosyltransferase-like PRPP-binding protein
MSAPTKPTSPRKIKGLDRHSGEWVAIVDDEVVAHASTLSSLREQVRERGRQVEGFFKVPPPRRGAGIFLQRHALYV